MRRKFPAGQRRQAGWQDRLLRELRGLEIALVLAPPIFQFAILFRELLAQGIKMDVRVDPRLEHGGIDRLRHEIVRAGAQAFDLVLGVGMPRQQDDGNLGNGGIRIAANDFTNLRAREFRHFVIEHQQRRPAVLENLQSLRAVAAIDRIEAESIQRAREQAAAERVVIDDQDFQRVDHLHFL